MTSDVQSEALAQARAAYDAVKAKGLKLNMQRGQPADADFDLTDGADVLKATVEVYREKDAAELAAEPPPATDTPPPANAKKEVIKLDRYKRIDGLEVILKEVKIVKVEPAPVTQIGRAHV